MSSMRFRLLEPNSHQTDILPVATARDEKHALRIAEGLHAEFGLVLSIVDYADHSDPRLLGTWVGGKFFGEDGRERPPQRDDGGAPVPRSPGHGGPPRGVRGGSGFEVRHAG